MILTIDFETRSAADIKKVGAARYAEDETTEVLCLAVKANGGAARLWLPKKFRNFVAPEYLLADADLRLAMRMAEKIVAHNAQFEYFIWKYVMKRHGFGMFDVTKLRCSAAMAATCGLPRDLAGAGAALGLAVQKDNEGYRLMLRMCKPRRPVKADLLADPSCVNRVLWHEKPEDISRLAEYCRRDVDSEYDLFCTLPELTKSEQEIWLLDLKINDRGVRIDRPVCERIKSYIDKHTGDLTREFVELSGGKLNSANQRDALMRELADLGVEAEGLRKGQVEEMLAGDLPDTARRMLEIRKSVGQAAAKKYVAFLSAAMSDDRLRGMFMYYGAGTGRWSGRIVQPQNFARGAFEDVEGAIDAFLSDNDLLVQMMYGDPITAAATCVRGMIVPSEGCDFIDADYSSIEGRVLAWLARDETALDVYLGGRDPYKVAASAIFHVGYDEVDKKQRQVGKTAELACGYQGGANAFAAMGRTLGVIVPEDEAKGIVAAWRDSRPVTVAFWRRLDSAAKAAIRNPGKVYSVNALDFLKRDRWLKLRLPSGRVLYYFDPVLGKEKLPWGEREIIMYMGVDSTTHHWPRQKLYGGLLAENVTQATARDILANGMLKLDAAGYRIVLHVHDEACSEVEETDGRPLSEYENLMCSLPDWAAGLPLKAEAWRGRRFKK